MRIYNVILVGDMGFRQVLHIGQTKSSAIPIAFILLSKIKAIGIVLKKNLTRRNK